MIRRDAKGTGDKRWFIGAVAEQNVIDFGQKQSFYAIVRQ